MSGGLLLLAAALGAPLAAGAGWYFALGERPAGRRIDAEAAATAWLFGWGWIGFVLATGAIAGLRLHPGWTWPAALAPAALLLLPRPRRSRDRPAAVVTRSPPASGRRAWEYAALVAIGLLLAFYLARALPDLLGTPLKAHDAVGIWGLKALAFFHDEGIRPAFLTLDRNAPLHPDYPILLPMFGAWLLDAAGGADERWLKLPSLLAWLALFAILLGFGRRRAGVVPAATLAAAFVLIDQVFRHSLIVTADLLLATLALRAVVGLARFAEARRMAELRIAAACLALAAATKNEGLAMAVAGGLCVLGLRAGGGGVRRVALAVAVPATALLIGLPWIWFRWRHDLHSDLFAGVFLFGESPDHGPAPGPGRLPWLAMRALQTAFGAPGGSGWNLFWGVAALAAALALLRGRRAPVATRLILGFTLLCAAADAFALCISPHDIVWHADTAIPRLLLHLAAPLAALVPVVVGDYLNTARTATMVSDAAPTRAKPPPGNR